MTHELSKYKYLIMIIWDDQSYLVSGWDYKEDAQDSLNEILEHHPKNPYKARIVYNSTGAYKHFPTNNYPY